MSYNDFLNQFVGIISSFVSWLSMVANSLIHNYFYITIFGLVLFVSFFWFVYNIIFGFLKKLIFGYDEYNDLYEQFVLKKQVQSDYLDNHYEDEFDYRYRSKLLSLQVLNGVYQNNKDLLVENKIENLQANIDALKKLKQVNLNDDDDSNDNDVDMLVPNPPVQLANFNELNSNNLLIDDISNNYVNHINKEYYLSSDSDLYLVNKNTGEVIPRFIDDYRNNKFDLLTGKSIKEDEFISLCKKEDDLKYEDSLNGEYIGVGGH